MGVEPIYIFNVCGALRDCTSKGCCSSQCVRGFFVGFLRAIIFLSQPHQVIISMRLTADID